MLRFVCLLLIACGASTPTVEEPAPPPTPRVVKVLTHNVWFLSPISRDNVARAEALPSTFEGHDVVVLSEVFEQEAREVLAQGMEQLGFNATPVLGADAPEQCESQVGPLAISTPLGMNGGVMIFSPHPIDAHAERVFRPTCLGEDCCAAKGVLYARIQDPEGCLHVFGTHLQNQSPVAGRRRGDPAAVRSQQLQMIREFIDEMDLDVCPGPVFVAGDLNLQPHELEEATQILNAHTPEIRGPRSWGDGNAYSQSDEPEHLDYVLVTRDFDAPLFAINETRLSRTHHAFTRGSGIIGIQREGVFADLSDHHPVAGHFEWDALVADEEVRFIEGELTPQVDGLYCREGLASCESSERRCIQTATDDEPTLDDFYCY